MAARAAQSVRSRMARRRVQFEALASRLPKVVIGWRMFKDRSHAFDWREWFVPPIVIPAVFIAWFLGLCDLSILVSLARPLPAQRLRVTLECSPSVRSWMGGLAYVMGDGFDD